MPCEERLNNYSVYNLIYIVMTIDEVEVWWEFGVFSHRVHFTFLLGVPLKSNPTFHFPLGVGVKATIGKVRNVSKIRMVHIPLGNIWSAAPRKVIELILTSNCLGQALVPVEAPARNPTTDKYFGVLGLGKGQFTFRCPFWGTVPLNRKGASLFQNKPTAPRQSQTWRLAGWSWRASWWLQLWAGVLLRCPGREWSASSYE